ncbi:MAG: BamA/TamA family outer membrane protein, partial [Planctomycetota bacterium]
LHGPSGDVEESPFSFGFDLFHRVFTSFDYDQTRTGASVSTGKRWRVPGRRIDDVWSVRLTYVHENVTLDDLESRAPPNTYVFEGVNQIAKLRIGLFWSHVDLPAVPGDGWDMDLLYTLAGGPLGREVDYHKLEWGGTKYFTIYENRRGQRHLLRLNLKLGWAREFAGTEEVPPFDRFLAGGFSTVRGFKFGEVGPRAEGNPFSNRGRKQLKRSLEDGDGDPTGGQGMWLARAEYDFPIIEQTLRGVLFLDSGNVTPVWDDDLLETYRVSWGFGIRLKLGRIFGPVPLALDFAWPIRREEGDDTQLVTFSISRPFL